MPLRITKITLEGWPALGPKPITVTLEPRCTVLIGKNGSGKSLLADAICESLCNIVGLYEYDGHEDQEEKHVCVSFESDDGNRIDYECRWQTKSRRRSLVITQWQEECRAGQELLWSIKDGELIIENNTTPWRRSAGLLNEDEALGSFAEMITQPEQPLRPQFSFLLPLRKHAENIIAIYAYLVDFFIVDPGLTREVGGREELAMSLRSGQMEPFGNPSERLRDLMKTAIEWHETDKEGNYAAFVGILKRLEVIKTVDVVRYTNADAGLILKELQTELLWLEFDGLNMALASDGTLRIAEIVMNVLESPEGGMVLIEEPEEGVHPGLLEGLLNEFDSYALDRQIVLTTHSPLVLDWAAPSAVRLVTRHEGQTQVRTLTEQERSLARDFVQHAGTLGEYVFQGGVGDEDDQVDRHSHSHSEEEEAA